MTTQPPGPPPVTDIELTNEIKEAINGAYANGTPWIVAYVDEDGQPSLSVRGSTQFYSANQLAIWIRNPEGGLPRALEKNPRVSLFFRDPKTRTNMNVRGRGRLDNSDAVRDQVYNNAPENEQKADAEKKGLPLIVDIDRLDGATPAGRLRMQRGGG